VDGAVTDSVQRTGWADVLVGLRSDVAPTVALAALAADADSAQADVLASLGPADFQLSKRYEYFPIVAGRVSASGLAKLRANPQVLGIDEDVWVYPLSVPASGLSLAESVPSVGADKVHKLGIRGQGIGVAVVDTGIDTDHPDLVDAIVGQVCFSSGTRSCAPGGLAKSDSAEDEQGHGTGVSSIVLGRGKQAPVGMAPEAKLIGVRVFRDQGGAPTQDIVDGLNWVVGKQNAYNIRIVNMSLGGGASLGTNCDDQFSSVKQVFQTLVARNVAIFVATGNGGNTDRVAFPACITWDTELTLSGADCHGQTRVGPTDITCYTDRGRAMDLVAPGSIIVTARMGGGASGSGPTAGGHGTSYASPSAAGVAALLLSADPSINARDIERILKNTGDVVIHPESKAEIKRVNAYKAVLSVLKVTPTLPATQTATATATGVPPSVTPTEVTPPTEPATATSTPLLPGPTDTPMPSVTPADKPIYRIFLPRLQRPI
jgi:serine protease AprX